MEKKKKSIIKIIILIIILFFSSFLGTYLGNNYYDKQKKNSKDEQVIKDKKEDKKQEEIVEDKGKIEIYYEEEKKDFISDDGKLKITNSIKYPKTITIESKAEEKIKSTLKKIVDSNFLTVNNQAQEQVGDYNKNKEGSPLEYGVSYSFSEIYVSYDVLSFLLTTSGSMGGTGWENKEYYNFSYTTGELLKIEDICIDVSKCRDIMIEYFLNELKKDERLPNLNEQYETIVKEELLKNNTWGYDSLGIRLVIPKYSIASGSDGLFEYTISKDVINEYLIDNYKIKA